MAILLRLLLLSLSLFLRLSGDWTATSDAPFESSFDSGGDCLEALVPFYSPVLGQDERMMSGAHSAQIAIANGILFIYIYTIHIYHTEREWTCIYTNTYMYIGNIHVCIYAGRDRAKLKQDHAQSTAGSGHNVPADICFSLRLFVSLTLCSLSLSLFLSLSIYIYIYIYVFVSSYTVCIYIVLAIACRLLLFENHSTDRPRRTTGGLSAAMGPGPGRVPDWLPLDPGPDRGSAGAQVWSMGP